MQDNHPRETARNFLLNELFDWKKSKRCSLTLLKENFCDDDRLLLKISIGPEKVFSLYCPFNYPSDDGNFFVETESVNHLWCNSLNEFILDASDMLTLSAVLDKALSLDLCTVDSPCVSSDSEEENEEFMVLDNEDEDDLWEKMLWDKMKAWRIKEAAVRGSLKSPDKLSFCREASKKWQTAQIFSKNAASGILTNDLVHIIRSSKETGIDVEPVDDNIYEWCVRFSNFDPECQLHKDLERLNEKHKWNHIELHLRFSMDLYPFDPPVPHALRPRPEGSVRCIVACMDILKLSSWNPTRGMMSVLLEIKQYLATYATLKIETCLRQSSLLSIENILLQLAFVSEIPPRCPEAQLPSQAQTVNSSTSGASCVFPLNTNKTSLLPPNYDCKVDKIMCKVEKIMSSGNLSQSTNGFKFLNLVKKNKKQGNSFPNGIGYSNHSHSGWDINGYLAAKQEKDKKLECVLEQVLINLRDYLKTVDENANPTNVNRIIPIPPDSSCPIWDPMSDLYEALRASTLIPFLEDKLKVDSFVEINQHKIVYRCLVDILTEIVSRPWLISLLAKQPEQEVCVCDLLHVVKNKAQVILNICAKAENTDVTPEKGKKRANSGTRESFSCKVKEVAYLTAREPPHMIMAAYEKAHMLNMGKMEAGGSTAKSHDPEVDDLQLAKDLCELSNKVDQALQNVEMEEPSVSSLSPKDGPSSSKVDDDKDLSTRYINALKELQFVSCDIDVSDIRNSAHSSSPSIGYIPGRSVVMRIAQELSSLSTSLPLDLASAIFVRTDDSKCTVMKALIIGPEGTPYSGGCFLFDIMFPSTYPKIPPSVLLRTTGRNKFRFNPNLYANGKVCLSLLGTWSGLQGEQWHETSTVLQVLVSIQSLIMNAEPYFNEPGYESEMGTDSGRTASLNYNHNVRYHTIMLAMVEHLQHPPPNFEEVIKRHFLIKGERIEKEIKDYVKEHPLIANLKTAQKALSEELGRLRRQV